MSKRLITDQSPDKLLLEMPVVGGRVVTVGGLGLVGTGGGAGRASLPKMG